MLNNHLLGILVAILAGLCFAPGGIFVRFAGITNSFEGLFWRISIFSVLSFYYLYILKRKTLKEVFIPDSVGSIVVSFCYLFNQLGYMLSILFMPVSYSLSIIILSPLLATFATGLFFKASKLSVITISSVIMSVAGLGYAFISEINFVKLDYNIIFGVLSSLLSILCMVTNLTVNKLDNNIPIMSSYFRAAFFGTIFLFPFISLSVTFDNVMWLLCIGFFAGFGYIFVGISSRFLFPSESSILLTLEPIVGVILAVILLDENLSFEMITGIIIAIMAVIINASYSIYMSYKMQKALKEVLSQ